MTGLAHLPCCGQVGSPTSHSFLWSRRCTPSPQKLPTGTTASVLPHCRHRDPVLPARGKPPLVECQHGVRGNRGCSLGGLPPVGSFLGGSHRGWSSLERALMGGGCPSWAVRGALSSETSFPGGLVLRILPGKGVVPEGRGWRRRTVAHTVLVHSFIPYCSSDVWSGASSKSEKSESPAFLSLSSPPPKDKAGRPVSVSELPLSP